MAPALSISRRFREATSCSVIRVLEAAQRSFWDFRDRCDGQRSLLHMLAVSKPPQTKIKSDISKWLSDTHDLTGWLNTRLQLSRKSWILWWQRNTAYIKCCRPEPRFSSIHWQTRACGGCHCNCVFRCENVEWQKDILLLVVETPGGEMLRKYAEARTVSCIIWSWRHIEPRFKEEKSPEREFKDDTRVLIEVKKTTMGFSEK